MPHRWRPSFMAILLGAVLLSGPAAQSAGSTAQTPAGSTGGSQQAPDDIAEAEARLYTGAGGFAFANGRDARNIPFEINSDKIYVQVRLNGQGPFWLMLDTGSPGMILDTATAARLGLPLGKAGETVGAGEGTFQLFAVDATVDAELPGVTLQKQPAAVGPLDRVVGPFEGRRLEGLLGCHNLMTRFVVEIDYARRLLHFIAAPEFKPGPGARTVPLTLVEGHPFVEATLEPLRGAPIQGSFLVDTGMRRQLLLTAPFVDRNELLARSAPTVLTTTGGGLGGQAFAHVGRIRSLRFGEVTVKDFPASLSQAKAGLVATEFAAGVIGAAILQRYRVAFDYSRNRLLFWEQEYDADDLDYDKSGLFLVADVEDRSRIRVIDVAADSPAAEAGLKIDDRLTAMDGQPLGELALERVRRRLRGPAAGKVDLTFERGGEPVRVTLQLRRIV